MVLQKTYHREQAYGQTKLGDISLVRHGKKYYLISDGTFIKQNQALVKGDIQGFEFAHADGVYFPVSLEQDKKGRLFVSRAIGDGLVSYRYAYPAYTKANLYNQYGIPVLPAFGRIDYK